jgi:DNA-binding GntR family transcriptional regulator
MSTDAQKAAAAKGASPRARAVLRTIPEQIAEDLGAQIATGVLKGGERLREVEIADGYGVSRAPVREAIRLLSLRGFAEFTPRRGAYVAEFSLDRVSDIFDIMGALIGLAARYAATLASRETLVRLGEMADELDRMAADPDCDPATFGAASWSMASYLSRNCGSDVIAKLIAQQFHGTAWATIWRRTNPDFRDQGRRLEAAALNRRRQQALLAGDGQTAEAVSREMARAARDQAVKALAEQRGEPIDRRRLGV